ncbi:MAG TPA: protein-glutamate O-methyltransferase CheR [Bacillales bacterium]|nr:protein-glutamate O-methyltransferase CheR [Bacillales bacterium]
MVGDDYIWFVDSVKKSYGLDLANYKETQMKRRLTALRDQKGCHDFHEFFKKMAADPGLLDVFFDRVTINVSSFFRNANRWKILEEQVLPRMIKSRKKLNIWSAACSTGEEPYTIAMLLSKHLPLDHFSILATDIDERVIAKAMTGRYSDQALQEVPEAIKQQFFKKTEGLFWEVDDRIKQTVRFQKHNLLDDPFSKNFDFIVCRNVLIYFTNEAKESLYHKFNAALVPDGVLFVGSTEQIFYPERYGFDSEETFFYRKKIGVREE